jgi:hypothetical protein
MGKVFKKVTKPIAKVFDKIIPNEIKPALPYLAAIAPFMLPAGFTIGGLSSQLSRAIASGAINLGSQAAQEGAAERGINPLSLALAAGSGYLSTPGAGQSLQGAQTVGTSAAGNISAADLASKYPGIDSAAQLGYSTDLSMLDRAANLGLEGLSKISAPLERATNADLLSMDFVKGAGVPLGMAASEQAYNAALDAQRDYEKELAAYNAMTGQISAGNIATRIKAITSSMTNAGFGESDIEAALRQIGLLAVGGRVGYKNGGIVSLIKNRKITRKALRVH